jgi:hypothetical protein
MTAYLLIFNAFGDASVDTMGQFLETLPEVRHWITCFSHGLIIISDRTASELQPLIHNRFPDAWFLIDPVEPVTSNGWLPEIIWEWISNPERSVSPIPGTVLSHHK